MLLTLLYHWQPYISLQIREGIEPTRLPQDWVLMMVAAQIHLLLLRNLLLGSLQWSYRGIQWAELLVGCYLSLIRLIGLVILVVEGIWGSDKHHGHRLGLGVKWLGYRLLLATVAITLALETLWDHRIGADLVSVVYITWKVIRLLSVGVRYSLNTLLEEVSVRCAYLLVK